jgi:orotate phosphoribosyltransferase
MSMESNIENIKEEIITFLFDNGAIKVGNFTLSSGLHSTFYLDLRILQSYPIFFRKTIYLLKMLVLSHIGYDGFDIICSIPTSGTIFGTALAYELFKPHSYLRKDSKSYGTKKRLEGAIDSKSKIIFVDDVVTTGQSVINGINTITDSKICGVYVVVNRGQGADKSFKEMGIELHSAISISEIFNILHKKEKISNNEFRSILDELTKN